MGTRLLIATLLVALAASPALAEEEPLPEAAPGEQIIVEFLPTEWTMDVTLTGGTLMAWDAPGEAGNAYALSIGVDWCNFRAALAVAGVLPDSRADGVFEAVWAEGWWTPFGRFFDLVAPYALAGIGVVTADRVEPTTGPEPVRWSADGPKILAMLGLGVAYGGESGLYLAVDLRAYNHTHGGVTLHAGWRF